MMVIDDSIREFAGRNWARIAQEVQRYWADQYARHGARATVRAAQQLWAQMKTVQPDWPSEAERAGASGRSDLAVTLQRLLDRSK